MGANNGFIDFPLYSIPDSSGGKLVKSNEFSHSFLTAVINGNEYNPDNMDFLRKIISALKISWDSDCRVRIFNESQNISITKLLNEDKSKYFLAFGFSPKQFNTQAILQINKWNRFDSFKLLLSFKLEDLKSNTSHKRILWNELQTEFNGK